MHMKVVQLRLGFADQYSGSHNSNGSLRDNWLKYSASGIVDKCTILVVEAETYK